MLLGAIVNAKGAKNALDIGAGTGVLSLMLAQRNTEIKITAVELDEASFEECVLNFENAPWKKRLKAMHEDILKFRSNEAFDLIVLNPPFYHNTLVNEDARLRTARHEASLPMARLFGKIAGLLHEHGTVWMIIPFKDLDRWKREAERTGLFSAEEWHIRGKEKGDFVRTIVHWTRTAHNSTVKKLTVRKADATYTDEYIRLTRDFHAIDLTGRR